MIQAIKKRKRPGQPTSSGKGQRGVHFHESPACFLGPSHFIHAREGSARKLEQKIQKNKISLGRVRELGDFFSRQFHPLEHKLAK